MWRTSITLVFCALLIGCGDDTKYQAELRGTWLLESRKSAQGEIVQSPQISGLIEWFPTTPTQAKVHLSVTDDRQSIRVIDRLYDDLDLQGTTFTYQSKLRIGDIATDSTDVVYDTTAQNGTGQISSDDARVTLITRRMERNMNLSAHNSPSLMQTAWSIRGHSTKIKKVFYRTKNSFLQRGSNRASTSPIIRVPVDEPHSKE